MVTTRPGKSSADRSRWGRWRSQRGSLSIYFVAGVVAMIPLIGLVVDGVGQIRAHQQASQVAAEAARQGANHIEMREAIPGQAVNVRGHLAVPKARSYVQNYPGGEYRLTGFGLDDPQVFDVRVSTTYQPLFLGAIGVGPMEVEAVGVAYLSRTDSAGEED